MTDRDCIFCKIVAGDADATVVFEDDTVVVFLDINPVTPGHMMVVPRAHLPELSDVDHQTGAHMFKAAQRMASALRESGLRCEGVNLFYADGEAAFQEVFHAHLHIFPRYQDDGFRLVGDWETPPSRSELDGVGSQIRKGLATVAASE